MYIYFKLLGFVLTCEEYPQVITVDYMITNNLENMCNKWEKTKTNEGKFNLSYKYKKETCSCGNPQYI